MIEAQAATSRPLIGVVDSDSKWLRKTRMLVGEAKPGYRVVTASDGLSALDLVRDNNLDLLLLSDPLPGLDTYSVVSRIREFASLPIIVLGYDSPDRAVNILEVGADNYLVKEELEDRELPARAEALLRRARWNQEKSKPSFFTNGELMINFTEHLVTFRGEEVNLTPTEYGLLAFLARQCGRTCLYEDILPGVWGGGYEGEVHLLQVHANRLRRDLGRGGSRYVVTIPGVGCLMPNLNHSEDERNYTEDLPLLNEVDSTDKMRLVVGPIDHKGQEDKLWFYEIKREQFAGESIPTAIINILRFLPDGMGVLTESLQEALGISRGALLARLSLTRVFLREQGSDYIIGNVIPFPLGGRYYWKKVR